MQPRWWSVLFTATGVMLGALGLIHIVLFSSSGPVILHNVIDVILIGGSALSLLYGGYWHRTNPLPEDRYPRIAVWMVGGVLLFSSLSIVSLYVGSRQIVPNEAIESSQLSGSVGVVAGLFVGTIEARAIVTAEEAARAEERAAALRESQERMEELNDLLRHYTLNSLNIIQGYANNLRSAVPEEHHEALDTIEEESQSIATLIQHIQSLPITTTEVEDPKDVDFGETLRAAISKTSTDDITATTPETYPEVYTDPRIEEGLALLISALTASTATGGELEITCDTKAEAMSVHLTATPAELSETVKQTLFEPVTSGLGLDLFLANEVLDEFAELTLVTNAKDIVEFDIIIEEPWTIRNN